MSRGAGWLTAGILLVLGSLFAGSLIQQSAIESFKRYQGSEIDDFKRSIDNFRPDSPSGRPANSTPRDRESPLDTVNRLSLWAGIANLGFYGGILAIVIGIVLLIIDGSRQTDGSPPTPVAPATLGLPGFPTERATSGEDPPPASSAVEEENRRLREELERLRRVKGAESG